MATTELTPAAVAALIQRTVQVTHPGLHNTVPAADFETSGEYTWDTEILFGVVGHAPDRNTHEPTQFGTCRYWDLRDFMDLDESGVVALTLRMVTLLALRNSVHETLEALLVGGNRVFDPHHDGACESPVESVLSLSDIPEPYLDPEVLADILCAQPVG